MRPFMRMGNAVMVLLFLSWAAFQYNDPDGLVWIGVYGAAAIQCILFFLGRLPRVLTLAYLILCVPWALFLAAQVLLDGEFIFDEQGREMFGLIVCAGWSFVLYRSTGSGPNGGPF